MSIWARRTGLGRVVLVDVLVGVPLITGLLTWAVATGLALTADVSQFAAGLADPLNYLLTATAFVGPVAAGTGALHAARVERSGVAALADSTARGRAGALRVAAISVCAWQLFAVLTAALILLIRSDLGGPRTVGMLLLLVLAICVVVACVVFGVALGSRWTSLVVPPATALLAFAWIYGWSFASGKPQRLSPAYPDVFYRVWFEPHLVLVTAQAGVLAALALLLSATTMMRAGRMIGVTVAALTLVCTGSLWAVTSADPVQYRSAPPVPPCRSSGVVSLCYWPESVNGVGASLRALSLVHTRLGGYTTTPTLYVETGLQSKFPERRPFEVPTTREGDFLFRAILAAVPVRHCTTQRALDAEYDLDDFYRTIVLRQRPPTAQLRRLEQGPRSEARSWVHRHTKALRDCR